MTEDIAAHIEFLRRYNAWRRDSGGLLQQPDPTKIGLAIDAVCNWVERKLTEEQACGGLGK